MAAWKFLIFSADGEVTGTDERSLAEAYAKVDDNTVVDCAAKATLDEDGDEYEDIRLAEDLADDEADED